MNTGLLSAAATATLRPTTKAVLIYLVVRSNEHGESCLSLTEIAAGSLVTRNSVAKAINALEHSNIAIIKQGTGRQPSSYRITPPHEWCRESRSSIDFEQLRPVAVSILSNYEGENDPNPEPTPYIQKTLKHKHTAHARARVEYARAKRTTLNSVQAERFARFYSAYPIHKARGDAEKAWKSLDPDEDLVVTMCKAIEQQITELQAKKNRGDWVPAWKLPATWLRAKCWLDETTTAEKKNRTREFLDEIGL